MFWIDILLKIINTVFGLIRLIREINIYKKKK